MSQESTSAPFFSIVMPLYNKEKSVKETIQSALDQSFSNFELLIINDGSTDDSLAKVNSFNDPRIKIISQDNKGVSYSRNHGITKSEGSFVCFLDADDLWEPHHLANFINALKLYTDAKFLANGYQKQIAENYLRQINNPVFNDLENTIIKIDDFFSNALPDILAWTSAVCVKNDVIKQFLFDTKITNGAGEDTDLWIRLALNFPLIFNKNISATHRLQSENRVSRMASQNRVFFDPQQYKSKNNLALNKFLDQNSLAIAVQQIIHQNYTEAKKQLELVDPKNLSRLQNFLIKLPLPMVRILYKIKKISEKLLGFQLKFFK